MDWLLAMGYGAIGGAIVEAVVSLRPGSGLERRTASGARAAARRPVPALTAYVDPLSDVAAGMTRILLGAVAGLLFHSEVTGAYAAIAVGCSAPAVLRQLGSARLGPAFELTSGASAVSVAETADVTTAEAADETAAETASETATRRVRARRSEYRNDR